MINKPLFKLHILSLSITLITMQMAAAGVVRDDVDYQLFRDFAENKGRFTVGAINLPIYDLKGNYLGTALREGIPMPDLSSADANSGILAALHAQYVVSVQHNDEHHDAHFGGSNRHPDGHRFTYYITGRNNYPIGLNGLNKDYHFPRLHKLITEIVPSKEVDEEQNTKNYMNSERYASFVRLGSGTQQKRNQESDKDTDVHGAYVYLTGGTPVEIQGTNRGNDWFDANSNVFGNKYSPLVVYGIPGDSGSSIWTFDRQNNEWRHFGVLNFNNSNRRANTGTISRPQWHKSVIAEDNVIFTNSHSAIIYWTIGNQENTSTLSNEEQSVTVNLFDKNLKDGNDSTGYNYQRPTYDHGKTVRFTGQAGKLNLRQNINQGAGALYFDTDFTVISANDSVTWQGAGISVAKDKTVHWKVKNPKNDRLSKIGEGTLIVDGNGSNQGEISVGDGEVILAQTNGYAFNQLGIVSGRPTVRLDADNQINPNNIYFGFRGGRLDVNGHNLNFQRIQNTDDGARIVNHNPNTASTIIITGTPLATVDNLRIADRVVPNQDLYHWKKTTNLSNGRQYDYFLPTNGRTSNHPEYTTNQTSNAHWEYLGDDPEVAKRIAAERKNQRPDLIAYDGYFGESDTSKHNGELNVTFNPDNPKSQLLLSGGTQLNGNLTSNGGTLLLSGRPTPHSYDFLKKSDVIYEDDWLNRTFNATNIIVNNNATLTVGRNVSAVNANLTANNNATFNLGLINNSTTECIRSDYTGVVKCENKTLSDKALASSPELQITGNATLNNDSSLNLGKAHLTGRIQGAGNVSLQADSRWTMTDDSTVKNLDLKDGSRIRLNGTDTKHHTLNVQGDLSGVGTFYLNSNITRGSTDKIIVSGTASGTHTLYVNNTGLEPKPHELELLKVGNKGEQLSVSLGNENGRVDLGTYRYQLFEKENSYVLGVAHRNALSNLINEDAPTTELPTQKGSSVTTEEPPSIEFRNGAGVTAEDAPVAHFKNGTGVTTEDAPVVHFKNGTGVTTEDAPVAHFKNGAGVTAEDASVVHFKNGAGVTAEDAPVAHFKNGAGVTAEDAFVVHFKNGAGVTTEDSPQQSYISRYSNMGLSELSAQVNSLLHINQNIDREIINRNQQDSSVWVQFSKQKSKQESDLYRPYQQSINLTQFGIEQRVGNDITVGSVLSHSSDHSQFDDGIAGKQNLKQINLYTKKMWDNGIFTAIDGSYTSSRTKLNNQLTFKRHIFSLGSILGKEWVLNNVIFKPSIGVRYYHLSKSNYSVNNANIEIEPINMISYQAGFSLSKIIQLGEFKFKPEISSYFVDASLKKLRVNVNQNALQQQFGRYMKNEITSTLQNHNWNISISLGFTKGNEIKNQRFATLKLGYNW
ncbi:S6 family peptidase [Ursidibacter sp. B-7004-1]